MSCSRCAIKRGGGGSAEGKNKGVPLEDKWAHVMLVLQTDSFKQQEMFTNTDIPYTSYRGMHAV